MSQPYRTSVFFHIKSTIENGAMTSTCTWKFSGISRENCVYTVGNLCEAIFQASKQAECLSLLTPRCLKSCPIQDTFSIQFKLLSAPMYFFAYSGVSVTTYHRFITIKILAKTTSAFFSSDSLHLHGHRSAELCYFFHYV